VTFAQPCISACFSIKIFIYYYKCNLPFSNVLRTEKFLLLWRAWPDFSL